MLVSFQNILLILLLTAFSGLSAQVNQFERGNKVKISADLYSVKDASTTVVIPDNKYTLLFQYSSKAKEADTKDSILKLEKSIAQLISKYKISNLRVICYSFDKGNDYKEWLAALQKKKPFKEQANVSFEYYNTGEFASVAKTLKKLFSRCVFIAPEGKLLAKSNSIGVFSKEADNLPGISNKKLKAKLLTDSSGSRIPLIKTVVCFVNEMLADTFAQARTDEYGNFEMSVPEKENAGYDLTVKQNEKYKPESVILAAQNGVEIATFTKTKGGFKYRMLQADVQRLEEIEMNDITLSFKNFKSSTNTKLQVIEQIVYASGKFDLNTEALKVLDKVASILKENQNVKMEVISHTDAVGEDASNMTLSIKRSEAVINYLASKGIQKSRLNGIGKGETMIRNRCANGVECNDKEHEYNRRTEFNFSK